MRALAFFFVLFFALPAHAEDTTYVPNRPLLVAGAALFVAGYAPAVVSALPSTAGLAYRGLTHAVTGGTYYAFVCVEYYEADGGVPAHSRIADNYLCSGEHGAIQLLVPFVGPLLFLKNHPHDDIVHKSGEPFDKRTQIALVAGSVAQIAGFAVTLAAVALGHSEPKTTKRAGAEWHIRPAITSSSIGIEASLVDF